MWAFRIRIFRKCIASDAVQLQPRRTDAEHRPIFEGDVVLVEVTSHSGRNEVENFSLSELTMVTVCAVIGNRDSAKYFSSYVRRRVQHR